MAPVKYFVKVGEKYNYWKVLEIVDEMRCKCLCTGCNQHERVIENRFLFLGKPRSCGCVQKQLTQEAWEKKNPAKKINIGDMFYFWKVLSVKNRKVEVFCTGCNQTTRTLDKWNILRGETKSCGCQKQDLAMKHYEKTRKEIGIGFISGYLEVIEFLGDGKNVKCKCNGCGNEHIILTTRIKNKKIRSCGCKKDELTMEAILKRDNKTNTIKVGDLYGYWKVVSINPKDGIRRFECICVGCEKQTKRKFVAQELLSENSRSCGCKTIELRIKTNNEIYGTDWGTQTEQVQQKRKETNREIYGVDYACQNPEVKEKKEKTTENKYGFKSAIQNPEIMQRKNETIERKWGVKNISQHPDIKQRKIETCREHWNVDNPNQSQEIIQQRRETCLKTMGVEHHSLLPQNRNKLRDWCEEHSDELYQSKAETELLEWVKTYYPSTHKFKKSGNEIDVFIPELNIGIEFNGLYWHNEQSLSVRRGSPDPIKYHLNKTEFFKQHQIQIIHIWEYEWKSRQQQIKNILSNRFRTDFDNYDNVIESTGPNQENAFLKQNYYKDVQYQKTLTIFANSQMIGIVCFDEEDNKIKVKAFCNRIGSRIDFNSIVYYMWKDRKVFYKADLRLENSSDFINCKIIETLSPKYIYWQKNKNTTENNIHKEIDKNLKDNFVKLWDCGSIILKLKT